MKSFTESYKLKVEKQKRSLRVTKLMSKLLFFHLQVTNLISNYSNSRILYWNEILYNSELVGKNIGMLEFKLAEKTITLFQKQPPEGFYKKRCSLKLGLQLRDSGTDVFLFCHVK